MDRHIKQKHSHTSKKLEKLEEELKEQKKLAKEFKEVAQRVQADFENFSKRMEKEKEEFKNFANAKLIEEFLPVLDSFDKAISSMQEHENVSKQDFLDGLKRLKSQYFGLLEKKGLVEIECEGKKFDPHFHEVMLKEHDNSKEDEIVLEQIQKGYLLNDKVLRTSKVKINKLEEKKK